MIITVFLGVQLNCYSWKEWKEFPQWQGGCLGLYLKGEEIIHLLVDIKGMKESPECPPEYLVYPDNMWEEILLHEYVHFLQELKGGYRTMVPLGLVVPIKKRKLQKIGYPESEWVLESEAFWVQKRPGVLKTILPDWCQ
jgi:hypothetical protein